MLNRSAASASGARLTGDDLQHAVAWHSALRTQVDNAGVRSVTVEASGAGNVDDVVIEKVSEPPEYFQVKATTSASHPITTEWLSAPSRSRGPSVLQKIFASASELRQNGELPQLTLVTNRSIDPRDPLLTVRDRNDRLATGLRAATGPVAAARDALAEHLGCEVSELLEFLQHLRLRTDASEAVWRDHIYDISYAAGVRADPTAFRLGVAEVREWVKSDRVTRTRSDIAAAIDRLELRVRDPFTVIAIKALDEGDLPVPDNAALLDWVPYFRGDEARTRRGLKDPRNWNSLLRPQVRDLARSMRSAGARQILVTGTMRLPTWFAVGVEFQDSAGFTVAKVKDNVMWTRPDTRVDAARIVVSHRVEDLPVGQDIALALAVSADLTPDVQVHMANVGLTMPIVTVQSATGTSTSSIEGPAHNYALALAVRDLARHVHRVVRPPKLHLFIAGPAAFALILGALWDRVPTTQTYEDLSGAGYEAAFTIPN